MTSFSIFSPGVVLLIYLSFFRYPLGVIPVRDLKNLVKCVVSLKFSLYAISEISAFVYRNKFLLSIKILLRIKSLALPGDTLDYSS